MATISVDGQWQRINDEMDSDGNRTIPVFARHVRTQGGMIIGRIVRGAAVTQTGVLTAQRWRYGRFTDIGEFTSFDEACAAIEALP